MPGSTAGSSISGGSPGIGIRPPGWNYDEDTVESWVKHWNAYHVDTIEYFRDRPEKLLLVNYIRDPEAAAKIAAFLGHSIPIEKAFANRNPGASEKLKNAEMLARILTRLGIPETEWKSDIHCPSYTHVEVARIPADTGRL